MYILSIHQLKVLIFELAKLHRIANKFVFTLVELAGKFRKS